MAAAQQQQSLGEERMSEFEDLASVLQDVPEDDSIQVEMSVKLRNPAQLNEESLKKVIQDIREDPVLAISDLDICGIVSGINVQDLLCSLSKMTEWISTSEVFKPSCREKAWGHFHKNQELLMKSVSSIITCPPVAALVIFKTMEELINSCASQSAKAAPKSEVEPVTKDEEDILMYVGGFVLSRTRKKCCKDQDLMKVVNRIIKDDQQTFTNKISVV